MKKIAASFLLVSLLFGLDFTFIKIFHNFKKGVRLYKKAHIKAQKYFLRAYALIQKSKIKNSSQIQYFLSLHKRRKITRSKKIFKISIISSILARACNDIDLSLLKIKGE